MFIALNYILNSLDCFNLKLVLFGVYQRLLSYDIRVRCVLCDIFYRIDQISPQVSCLITCKLKYISYMFHIISVPFSSNSR